jgi:hypothetical protein
LWWLLDRVFLAMPIPLLPPICMAISSTYTCVMGSVSSHNERTVAPCYGELLALLVIPTWLLHWFLRFESLSNCIPLAWNLPLSVRYLRYKAAPLLVPARGALVVVA